MNVDTPDFAASFQINTPQINPEAFGPKTREFGASAAFEKAW